MTEFKSCHSTSEGCLHYRYDINRPDLPSCMRGQALPGVLVEQTIKPLEMLLRGLLLENLGNFEWFAGSIVLPLLFFVN